VLKCCLVRSSVIDVTYNPTSSPIVRNAEKSAKAIRQTEKYVSRALDATRFGLQSLARRQQETSQTSNDPGATTYDAKNPGGDTDAGSPSIFSSSVSPQQPSATASPFVTQEIYDEEQEGTTEENSDVNAVTSNSTQQTTNADAAQGDGVPTDAPPELNAREHEKAKRWGVDLDELKA
jgi:hypothetical protein